MICLEWNFRGDVASDNGKIKGEVDWTKKLYEVRQLSNWED